DWFEKTNAQEAFAQNATTRTVLHGQAAKGNAIATRSFIIAVSGLRHEDGLDFLATKASDDAWDDISDAFENLYRTEVAPQNHQWLSNFSKAADMGTNDTNSQVQQVHIHVLSHGFSPDKQFIGEQRSFYPHPKPAIVKLFADNKLDILGTDIGQGMKSLPLPAEAREAKEHYAIVNPNYKSFPDFILNASRAEKRDFWKAVAKIALPLVENGKGARVGYYNMQGAQDQRHGMMTVEIAGGENLGQNGLKKRWFDNPAP
ncbi:MAG TPA: hypothetical protein VEF76_10690, partial [Patescibacteria group bacterium]|nr:hypothetical protein [Patescibacteria group bacterium]